MEFYNVKIKRYIRGNVQLIAYSRYNVLGVPSVNKDKKRVPVDYSMLSTEDIIYRKSKCIRDSVNRSINKIYDIARANEWKWFVTLTFNPEKVDSFDYAACTKKLSKWLAKLKEKDKEMKYLVIPEKHKSGRYHFHALLSDCCNIKFVESGKLTDSGLTIYNIGNYKLGFTTAIEVYNSDGISKYICKYITKDLASTTKGKRRYWASKNVDKPKEEIFDMDLQKLDLDIQVDLKLIHYQQKDKNKVDFNTGEIIPNFIRYYELKYEEA